MSTVAPARVAIWCLAISLTAAVAAQRRVWIVDVQNRPGTDFTDLQVAVDRAPLGDILDVRDGDHGPWLGLDIRRGVTIQFQTGAGLTGARRLTAYIPAGQDLVIGGLRANDWPPSVGVEIGASQGTISLSNCTLGWSRIRGARQVTLVGGSSRTLDIEDSTVALTGCRIVGLEMSPPPYCFPAWGALAVRRSHVTIDACTLAPGWVEPSCTRWYQSATIGLQDNSSVHITRGTTVQGGIDGTLTGDATSGVVVLDPSIAQLAHSPTLRVERRVVPALSFQPPAVGRTAPGAIHAAGALGACAWVGRPIPAVLMPGLTGAWAVDPVQSILFVCGVPQNGVLGYAIAVPPDPALVGVVVALQGLVWLPAMTVTTWTVELIRG